MRACLCLLLVGLGAEVAAQSVVAVPPPAHPPAIENRVAAGGPVVLSPSPPVESESRAYVEMMPPATRGPAESSLAGPAEGPRGADFRALAEANAAAAVARANAQAEAAERARERDEALRWTPAVGLVVSPWGWGTSLTWGPAYGYSPWFGYVPWNFTVMTGGGYHGRYITGVRRH